jgi:myo-inositol 2-dehydrogenase / D-chiro-inositol 1-dehydrogenase
MLRFGLFGAGRIGRVHAASVAAHPRTELAVVHDPVQVAAHEVAALYGATPTADAEVILGDPGIDAVIIASPTPTHVDLLTACAQAGKAVLCEKPIDLDLTRVDACWEAIKGLNATVMVGFNRRFDPTFAEVRERVADGEIGRLEELLITSRDPAPAPAAYIASSGGLFRDMTIHDFDMARFFLGEVVEVQAMGANLIEPYIAEAGDVDSAVVSMRGAGGELCQVTNSRRCAFGYDQRVEVFGAEGMLSAGNQTATSVRRSGAAGTETAAPYLSFFLDRYAIAYRAELDHLVICMEQGLTPSPGFADGRAALVLAEAATESMKTGRAVRVGLQVLAGAGLLRPGLGTAAPHRVQLRQRDRPGYGPTEQGAGLGRRKRPDLDVRQAPAGPQHARVQPAQVLVGRDGHEYLPALTQHAVREVEQPGERLAGGLPGLARDQLIAVFQQEEPPRRVLVVVVLVVGVAAERDIHQVAGFAEQDLGIEHTVRPAPALPFPGQRAQHGGLARARGAVQQDQVTLHCFWRDGHQLVQGGRGARRVVSPDIRPCGGGQPATGPARAPARGAVPEPHAHRPVVGTPLYGSIPGRLGQHGPSQVLGHRGDGHLGATAAPAHDPNRPAVARRQAGFPVRRDGVAENGRVRRQQRTSRPDLAQPRRAGIGLGAGGERREGEHVHHVARRIEVVNSDRQREQAGRIEAGGVADSHEPRNRLPGSGHGSMVKGAPRACTTVFCASPGPQRHHDSYSARDT